MLSNFLKFRELKSYNIEEINNNNQNHLSKLKVNLSESIFIDKKIINTINNFNIIKSYKININGDIIFLNIIDNKEIKNKFLEKIINTIIFFRSIDINFHKIDLTINLFLTNYKKKFPNQKSLIRKLDAFNVNTGYTTFINNSTREIYLYRKEEINKVLIHEMIHAYNIDMNYIYNHLQYSNKLTELYNINSQNGLRMYESYTESLAIILHSIKISIELKIDIDKILKDEINFSLNQIRNILDFYDINNLNELKDKKKEMNETSSVFSYYIIKGALLNNLNEYFKFLNKYNINLISKKSNNDDSISKFYELIIKSLNKKSLNNIKKYNNKENTLKMSFYN